mgnify:CR=1 FL=1
MYQLKGQQFGRLLVVDRAGSDKAKNATWRCRCDCGKEKVVSSRDLITGDTRSCGCLQRELVRERMTTHKASKTIVCGLVLKTVVTIRILKTISIMAGKALRYAKNGETILRRFQSGQSRMDITSTRPHKNVQLTG